MSLNQRDRCLNQGDHVLKPGLVTENPLPRKSRLKTTRARTPQREPPDLKTKADVSKVDVKGVPNPQREKFRGSTGEFLGKLGEIPEAWGNPTASQ